MGLLGYLKPASKAEKAQGQIALDEKSSSANEPPIDLPPLSPSGQRTPYTGATTPYGSSRPASIYPVGDFRNQAMEEILEVKCDVMINWLHQQQMERLWTAGTVDEGVVLKKTRGAFTCVPNSLRNEPIGLFSAIQTLNVRVRGPPASSQWFSTR